MEPKTSFKLLVVLTALVPFGARAEAEKPEIGFSGFFDGYYSYNFNNPRQITSASSSNNVYRYYDTAHNQLTLNLAELSVKATACDVSFVSDFDFGPFADLNSATSSQAGVTTAETSKNIGQAVVTYHPANSRWTFDAGKMYSHLGVETVKSKDNFNYSRSILFSYAIPFWHTGVHAGYDLIPGKLQSSLYIYNGWNSQYDVNRSKTIGAQVHYSPSESTSLTYNFIGGPERSDSESDWKTVHELTATLIASQAISIIADSVYGFEINAIVGSNRLRAEWYGALLGLKFQYSEKSYLSPRFEVYRDQDGYTLAGPSQTVESLTLTYGHSLNGGLAMRVEARCDWSNQNSFATDSNSTRTQTTLLAAGLFSF